MQTTADIQAVIAKANVTDILSIVIAAAVKLNSSDVHIEAEEKGIMVRFRVDGVLQDVATVDVHEWKKIINRIKLIASLKLNITDIPQDGRFTIFQKDKKIDVRTSTIPTAWGESVVMRILNPDSIQLNFEDLGFRPAALKRLLPEIEKPNGMILTTGPTGSGKTTTLYAILGKLNEPGVKIITLEDPVEYRLQGINQSQIDHSKDYTFSKGLRSILRQDPDIVMVGEIRDLETADAAIQAALTGHLLLSTIHTNDAAGAVPRFLSMGVKPFLLAPALTVAMGQRLLRKLCKECKQPDTVDADTLAKVNEHLNAITPASGETIPTERNFWKAVGCDKCNNTGYKGRVGAYEILIKNKKIEEFILSGEVSEYKMREVAAEQGMIDMAQDGLLKALEGMTTIDEVKRIVGL
jgi:type II secretory ATPase GspE/PulE/Tfp pilus assembly ATPase PilB-like protein